MDIRISNFPRDTSNQRVKEFLSPAVRKFTQRPVHYHKPRWNTNAWLTFLDCNDGSNFVSSCSTLVYNGRCLNLKKMPHPCKELKLRKLAMDEEKAMNKSDEARGTEVPKPLLPVRFQCDSFACGSMVYRMGSWLLQVKPLGWIAEY